MTEDVKYSRTQPCCKDCWNERNPERQTLEPFVGNGPDETCVYCGKPTNSGIYIRIDPAAAPHPSLTDES